MTTNIKHVALVTGATRGIGQAIALQLGQAGIFVIGTATTEQGVAQINEFFKQQHISGQGLVLDVSKPDTIEKFLTSVRNDFGPILILINNAGITRDALLLRMKDTQWNDIVTTNLNSVFHLSRACLKEMLKNRFGRIISISSVVASMGNPGQTNYAAAKAATEGFSRSLAREVAKYGITVNVVAPGFIDTDMTRELKEEQREQMLQIVPMGRLGAAHEVAAAVGFLASQQASYITGVTIHVNGGMYMT